jgi:hypothetical protein
MKSRPARTALCALVCLPIAAWAFYKPLRLLAPSLSGVSCAAVCTDSPARANEAAGLYEDALKFVEAKFGPVKSRPRAVFCGSEACAQSFGLRGAKAKTFALLGIIVGPRGWEPYYVRHELIHHVELERLGLYRFFRSPQWFKEGMAYSLSEDPRPKLAEPQDGYRSQFNAWLREVGMEHLWEQARKL